MTRYLLILASVTLAAVIAPRADAHVPPAEYILKKFVKMRSGIETIWVKSKVSAVVDGETTGIHFFDVTTYDPSRQTIQSLAFNEENKLLYAKTVKVTQAVEGQSFSSSAAAFASYLLFVDNPSYLIQGLTGWGVPIRVEAENYEPFDFTEQIEEQKALTPEGQEFDPRTLIAFVPIPPSDETRIRRWKETLAWVFGKHTGKNARQLWIEKDSFLPLRLVIGEGEEVQFEKYRFMKNYPYPATVSYLTNNEPVLISELTKVVINAPQKDFPRDVSEGFSEEGASGRLRTLIERFYSEVR